MREEERAGVAVVAKRELQAYDIKTTINYVAQLILLLMLLVQLTLVWLLVLLAWLVWLFRIALDGLRSRSRFSASCRCKASAIRCAHASAAASLSATKKLDLAAYYAAHQHGK